MAYIRKILGNVHIVSILGILTMTMVLKKLHFIFEGSPPLLIFLIIIAFSAWYGGLRAGLMTTVFSALASAYFLVEPYYSFSIAKASEILRVLTLLGVGTIWSLLIARLYKREKQALQTILDREVQLRQEIAARNQSQSDKHLYALLAKSSSEFIGMCDSERVPFFINEAGLRLVGLDTLEHGLKQPVEEFFFPEDRAFIINEFFPAILQCGRGETEIRFRHFKTGEALWMIYNVFVLKDLDDNIIGLGTVSTNITARKQTEEALRESQKDLNRAQAVAHIGSWRMDIRNNVLEWSDENFRIFGVPKGTPLTYQSFLNIVHPADRQLVDEAWKNALAGKPYDIQHRIKVGNAIKWVRELTELEFDSQGKLLGGFGTTEDITDIKKSQLALQHERAFLRQVIDNAPSMIFVKNRHRQFLLGNESLAHSYGTTPENLIGLTDDHFNGNSDEVSHFYQDDSEVIDTGKAKFIPEEKVTHADGSVHWYNTVKIPLFDDDNNCTSLLGVATDITERKHAEEMLREADKRKDIFLAMLAHELRNPLAPIRNSVQLLKLEAVSNTKLTWNCEVIERQITHMTRLLDDLLDVARIMQGKIRLIVERIELNDIVDNAIENSRPLLESRGQTLILSQSASPIWLEGDAIRLAQAITNLLNNASKYSDKGSQISLTVSTDTSEAIIVVNDTGMGISAEILPQIFDLFTQADHSLSHSQGGLGLGLTLVRRLIEMHGGSVAASSAGIGQGSTFTVRLPKLSIDGLPTDSLPSETKLSIPKTRILVVDDYSDALFSQKMLLEMEGHEVETADCGLKALEIARKFQPQVVLLDIGLPDLNGYEVAKQLRSFPETQAATLIALTGYGLPEDLALSQAAGFNHHMLKPVSFKKLSAILATLPIQEKNNS